MKLAIRNILRRKGRSLYAIIGIAIAISIIVAIVTLSQGVREGMKIILSQYRGDIFVKEYNSLGVQNSKLSEKLEEQLLAIKGVKQADPYVIAYSNVGISLPSSVLPFMQGFKPRIPLIILGVRENNMLFKQIKKYKGKKRFSEGAQNEMFVGAALVRQLERLIKDKRIPKSAYKFFLKQAGQNDKPTIEIEGEKYKFPMLTIKDVKFKVVSVFQTGSYQDGQIIVPLKQIQQLFDLKGEVNAYMIRLEKSADFDEVCKKIRAIKYRKKLWADKPEKMLEEYSDQHKTFNKIIWALMLLAAFSGSVNVLNTMASNVTERTREIGLLQAVGWSKFMIIRTIIQEGLILAIIGGIIGIFLGIAEIRILEIIIAEELIPQGFNFMVFVEGFVIAIVVGFVGSFLPAFRAARLYPVEALRYE